MLLCLTKIDDLPDVRGDLEYLCQQRGWPFRFLNAPTFDTLLEHQREVRAIFMNPNKSRIEFTAQRLAMLPNLQVICTASTGTVHIDMAAASNLGIEVISIKSHKETLKNISSTADLALALTLDGLRSVTLSNNDAKLHKQWDFENYIGKQLRDIKVGVVGYGRLGKIYAHILESAGADVEILDPNLSIDFTEDMDHFLSVTPDFDVVSLHIHAEGNENFFDNRFISRLRSDVVVVNTSRGEIVDHDELFQFLDRNPRAFYCTDVIPNEADTDNRNKFLTRFASTPNILVTQHIGGMSHGARKLAFGLASRLLLSHYGIAK